MPYSFTVNLNIFAFFLYRGYLKQFADVIYATELHYCYFVTLISNIFKCSQIDLGYE